MGGISDSYGYVLYLTSEVRMNKNVMNLVYIASYSSTAKETTRRVQSEVVEYGGSGRSGRDICS